MFLGPYFCDLKRWGKRQNRMPIHYHPPLPLSLLHVYISFGCDCRVWRRDHLGAWRSLPFHGTTKCTKGGTLVTHMIFTQAPPPHMRIDIMLYGASH